MDSLISSTPYPTSAGLFPIPTIVTNPPVGQLPSISTLDIHTPYDPVSGNSLISSCERSRFSILTTLSPFPAPPKLRRSAQSDLNINLTSPHQAPFFSPRNPLNVQQHFNLKIPLRLRHHYLLHPPATIPIPLPSPHSNSTIPILPIRRSLPIQHNTRIRRRNHGHQDLRDHVLCRRDAEWSCLGGAEWGFECGG